MNVTILGRENVDNVGINHSALNKAVNQIATICSIYLDSDANTLVTLLEENQELIWDVLFKDGKCSGPLVVATKPSDDDPHNKIVSIYVGLENGLSDVDWAVAFVAVQKEKEAEMETDSQSVILPFIWNHGMSSCNIAQMFLRGLINPLLKHQIYVQQNAETPIYHLNEAMNGINSVCNILKQVESKSAIRHAHFAVGASLGKVARYMGNDANNWNTHIPSEAMLEDIKNNVSEWSVEIVRILGLYSSIMEYSSDSEASETSCYIEYETESSSSESEPYAPLCYTSSEDSFLEVPMGFTPGYSKMNGNIKTGSSLTTSSATLQPMNVEEEVEFWGNYETAVVDLVAQIESRTVEYALGLLEFNNVNVDNIYCFDDAVDTAMHVVECVENINLFMRCFPVNAIRDANTTEMLGDAISSVLRYLGRVKYLRYYTKRKLSCMVLGITNDLLHACYNIVHKYISSYMVNTMVFDPFKSLDEHLTTWNNGLSNLKKQFEADSDATLTFCTKQAVISISEFKEVLNQLHQCKQKHKTIAKDVELLMELKRVFAIVERNRHSYQKPTNVHDVQESVLLVNELYNRFLVSIGQSFPEEQNCIVNIQDLLPHINSFLYTLNELENLIEDEIYLFADTVESIDGMHQFLGYLKKITILGRTEVLPPDIFDNVINVLMDESKMFKGNEHSSVVYSGVSLDYLPLHGIVKETFHIAHASGMLQAMMKMLDNLEEFTSNANLGILQESMRALWKEVTYLKMDPLIESKIHMDKHVLEPFHSDSSELQWDVTLPFACSLDNASGEVFKGYLEDNVGVISTNPIVWGLYLVLLVKSVCESLNTILSMNSNRTEDVIPLPPLKPNEELGAFRNTKWNELTKSRRIANLFTICNLTFLNGAQMLVAASMTDDICAHMGYMAVPQFFQIVRRYLRHLTSQNQLREISLDNGKTKWLQAQVTKIIQRWFQVSIERWCANLSDHTFCIDDYTVCLIEEDDELRLEPPIDEVRQHLYNKLEECSGVPKDVSDEISKLCGFESEDLLVNSRSHLEPAHRAIQTVLTLLEDHVDQWRYLEVTYGAHFEKQMSLNVERVAILKELDDVLSSNRNIGPQQIPSLHLLISEDLRKHKVEQLERLVIGRVCEEALDSAILLFDKVSKLGRTMGFTDVEMHSFVSSRASSVTSTGDTLKDCQPKLKPLWIDFDFEGFKVLVDNLRHQNEKTVKIDILSSMDILISLGRFLNPLYDIFMAKVEISKHQSEWMDLVVGIKLVENACKGRKCCMPKSWISSNKLKTHVTRVVFASNTITEEFIKWVGNSISELPTVYERLHDMVRLDWNKLRDNINTNNIAYIDIFGAITKAKLGATTIHDHLCAISGILKVALPMEDAYSVNGIICAGTVCMDEIIEYTKQWEAVETTVFQYYNIVASKLTKETFAYLKHELEKIKAIIEGQDLVWNVMVNNFNTLENLLNGHVGPYLYNKQFITRLLSIANELHPSLLSTEASCLTVKELLMLDNIMHNEIKEIVNFMDFQRVVKDYLDGVRSKWVHMNVVWKHEPISLGNKEEDGSADVKLWKMENGNTIGYTINEYTTYIHTYMSSKYVDDLNEELEYWNHKLSVTRTCIDQWIDIEVRLGFTSKIFLSVTVQQHLQEQYKALMELLRHQEALAVSMKCIKDIIKGETSLSNMVKSINKLETRLKAYLDDQRFVCPRFFFLRNFDLFRIVGQVDIAELQLHIAKMFPGIYQLQLDGELIRGMVSKESEIMPFAEGLPFASVDSKDLLICIEREMKKSLRLQIVSSVNDLNKIYSLNSFDTKLYTEWVGKYTSQVLILSLSVLWTRTMEAAKQEEDVKMLHSLLAELIHATIHLIGDTSLMLMKVEQISIFLIYQNNKTKKMGLATRDVCHWQRCIRYYMKDDGLVELHIGPMVYPYGYEYLGVGQELILTSLTEKCFVSISEGMISHLIGNPQGPAGTGKTESVKALANLCGYPFLVFNCNESFDSFSMEHTFAGLCQLGAWGIFDEFNRLTEGVLSAIAEQIQEINTCQKNGSNDIVLLGRKLCFNSNVAVFVTINPGYLSRSIFPLNMRMLCRPIVMEHVNLKEVISVLLDVTGVIEAANIANVLWNALKCCRLCFTEDTYDFGLRCAKLILYFIRTFVRSTDHSMSTQYPYYSYCILEKALLSVIAPRLPLSKLPILDLIIRSCLGNSPSITFGNICPSLVARDINFTRRLKFELCNGLEARYLKMKALELFHLLGTSKGIIMYGPMGSGKTMCLNALLDSLAGQEGSIQEVVRFDPNALESGELFGIVNRGEWEDGLFTSIIRKFTNTKDRILLVFDGDVDSSWIENMNSVLDDNMVLTLSNGNRIQLTNNITIVFETDCLQRLTLATISRCALVRFEPIQNKGTLDDYSEYFAMLEPEEVSTRYNLFKSFYNKEQSDKSRFIFAFVNAFGSQLTSTGYRKFISRVDGIGKKHHEDFITYEEAEKSVLKEHQMGKVEYILTTLVTNSISFVLRCRSDSGETNVLKEVITSLKGWFVIVLYLCKGCGYRTLLDVLFRHCTVTLVNSKYVMSPMDSDGVSARLLLVIKDCEVQTSLSGYGDTFWPLLRQILEFGIFYTRGDDNTWMSVHVQNVSIVLTTTKLGDSVVPQRLKRLLPIINGDNYISISETLDKFQMTFSKTDTGDDVSTNIEVIQTIFNGMNMLVDKEVGVSLHDMLLFQTIAKDSILGRDALWLWQAMVIYKYGHSVETVASPSLCQDKSTSNMDVPWLFEGSLKMTDALKERIRFMKYFYETDCNILTITGGDKSLRELLSQGVAKDADYRLIAFDSTFWPDRMVEVLENIGIHCERICICIDWDTLSLQSPEVSCHLKNMILQRDYTAIITPIFFKELQNRHIKSTDTEQFASSFINNIDCNLKFIVSSRDRNFDASMVTKGFHVPMPRLSSSFMGDICRTIIEDEMICNIGEIYIMYLCMCGGVSKFCDYILFVRATKDIMTRQTQKHENDREHLLSGIEKIERAKEEVFSMRQMLDSRRKYLVSKNEEAKNKLVQIRSLQEEADAKKKEAQSLTAYLEEERLILQTRSNEITRQLEQVSPLLEQSQQEVGSINRKSLDELRSMGNPPSLIKHTVETVVILLTNSKIPGLSWDYCRKVLKGADFISKILTFDPNHANPATFIIVKNRLNEQDWDINRISKASRAAGPLARWVASIVTYTEISIKVAPLLDEVERLETSHKDNEALLSNQSVILETLENDVAQYKEDYSTLMESITTVQAEIETTSARIAKSEHLVLNLSTEVDQWRHSVALLETNRICIQGDSILQAAMISLAGCLKTDKREELYGLVTRFLSSKGISYSYDFSTELNFDRFLLQSNLKYRHCILVDAPNMLYESLIDGPYKVVSACDDHFLASISSGRECKLTLLVKDLVHSTLPIKRAVFNEVRTKEPDSGFNILLQFSSDDLRRYKKLETEDDHHILNITELCLVLHLNMTPRNFEAYCVDVLIKDSDPDLYAVHEEVNLTVVRLENEIRRNEQRLLRFLLETKDILNDTSTAYLEEYNRERDALRKSLSECSITQRKFQELVTEYSEYTELVSAIYGILLRLESLNDFYLFDTLLLVHAMKTFRRRDERKLDFLQSTFRWIYQSMFVEDTAYLTFEFLNVYCRHICGDITIWALLKDLWSPKLDNTTFLYAVEKFKNKLLLPSEDHQSRIDTDIFENYNLIILVTKGFDDPTPFVESYTQSQGHNIKSLAMCALSELPSLESTIQGFISEGFWVLLKNAHLAPSWFKKFESHFSGNPTGPKIFITWDSSMALDRSILMRRYRIVYQSAETFQATLLQLFHTFGHMFDNAGTVETHLILKSLLVHTIAVCRQLYVPFGWAKLNMFDNNDMLLSLTATVNFIHDFGPFPDNSDDALQQFSSNRTLLREWSQRIHGIYASKISSEIDNLIMRDILDFTDHDAFPLRLPSSNVLLWIQEIPTDTPASVIGLPDSIEQLVLHHRVSKLREFTQSAKIEGTTTISANISAPNIEISLFDDVEPLLATALTAQLLDSCREYDQNLVTDECRKLAQFVTNPEPVDLCIFADPHKLLDMIRLFVAFSTGVKADKLELFATPIPETSTLSKDTWKPSTACDCHLTNEYLRVNHLELVGASYDFENSHLNVPKDSSLDTREALSIHLQWIKHTCNTKRHTTILPIYNSKRRFLYTLPFTLKSCDKFVHLRNVRFEGTAD